MAEVDLEHDESEELELETGTDEEDETEGDESEESTETDESEEGDGTDSEVVIQIGDEVAPASEEDETAPGWVKDLRKQNRELNKELRELKGKQGQQTEEEVKLPPKPTLADVEYDEDKYQEQMDAWYAKKAEIDAAESRNKSEQEKAEQALQEGKKAYEKQVADLKVKDFIEAESDVMDALPKEFCGLIMRTADNPALVTYALGKHPKKLAELALIKDPAKFVKAVALLEKDLKVTTRGKSKAAPETIVTGASAPRAGGSDAKLEQLRKKAEQSGDYTEVANYKRRLLQKKA